MKILRTIALPILSFIGILDWVESEFDVTL